MSILDDLARPERWEQFYTYKAGLACQRQFLQELRAFIDSRAYLSVCGHIAAGEPFPLPKKTVIDKLSSGKKRVVYAYPPAENTVLKLLTWRMLRIYDGIFADVLWSFRPGRTAKAAVERLARVSGGKYAYKADIGNYFNSVDLGRFLPLLRDTLADDAALYAFLASLLEEPAALDRGKKVVEQKGIMAGTPQASFYANLFLKDLDAHFQAAGIPYARYSDDIIVFADTAAALERHRAFIRDFLTARGLRLNPEKEQVFTPDEGWDFLGFHVRGQTIDLSRVSIAKMKGKMRRKTRALQRWAKRNDLDGEKAAKAFIRVFNRKLFENGNTHDLTWAYWFFPVLTTVQSLHEIDLYAQDCIRVLADGTRTKKRYNVRYEDLKRLGYRSLVHEYYAFHKKNKDPRAGRNEETAGSAV